MGMTRKPDEIMRVLNDPIPVHFHIGDPEPRLTPLAMVDLEELHADVLALIQQLQDDNAQLNRCIENMTDKLNAMNDEAAKLQAERDAAVADLEHVKDCDSCKYDDACFTGKKDCFGCHEKRCPCLTCQYEWRGVQKEE